MEKKFDLSEVAVNFFIDLGINTLHSIRDLTPSIFKKKIHRIFFIVSTMIGIYPITKFHIQPKHWILFGFDYFVIIGLFRTMAQLKNRKVNKQLYFLFKRNVRIINSMDMEKYIDQLNEIYIAFKKNLKTIRSMESDSKLTTFKNIIETFRKKNIFKVQKQPIKKIILRSAISIDLISRKKAELSHLLDTNIISIIQGSSKKIIVLKTCKQNIKDAEKMSDRIQYLLNEFGFNVTGVDEDTNESMVIYTIKTTSEFNKMNKKCSYLASRLGVDKKKVYMRENKGKIQIIISGQSKEYHFSDYIGCPEVIKNTKGMQVPIVIGIDLETGKLVCVDIARFPHALVMGGTGAGKSCFLNVLIQSAMYLTTNLAFLFFDFKKIELVQYRNFRNVQFINNYPDAIKAIDLLNTEMNRRLDLFAKANVKDLESYNLKFNKLPYLVVIIDEAADIKLEANDRQTAEQVNTALNQCINKARCTGIIIIYAMQRADSTQINCAIRDQLMTRIGFKTSSESQKQFIEIQNLTGLERGELRLKYEEQEKLIKCLFIDDKKLNTNVIYNILKKERE